MLLWLPPWFVIRWLKLNVGKPELKLSIGVLRGRPGEILERSPTLDPCPVHSEDHPCLGSTGQSGSC
ncbi:hypothetical protein M758_UG244600 [Ceratodon purpureus]|nr:hypothetical protein M758_UG244600 [Ceratodon purpureus]